MCFSVVKRRFTKRCEKKDVPAGRNRLRMILASQDGMGVVEVILIIVENLALYIEYIEGEKNLKNKLYTRYTQEHGQLKLSKKGK